MNPPSARHKPNRHVAATDGAGADRRHGGFPTLVDIATVARLLGVDARFVRRLVFERRVPYVKVGRYVRFDVEEVSRWLDRQRVREEDGAPTWAGRR